MSRDSQDRPAGASRRAAATPREVTLVLGRRMGERTLTSRLRTRFDIRPLALGSQARTYYDTFDWRLHRRGLRLHLASEDGQANLELSRVEGGMIAASPIEKVPRFARELPPGPLRAGLEKATASRRLLAITSVELRARPYAVLDDEEKTVLRLRIERAAVRDLDAPDRVFKLPTLLRIAAVRGYDARRRAVIDFLVGDCGLLTADADPLDRALAAMGRDPGQGPGRIPVVLHPEGSAVAAALELQRSMLAIMRANEDGIRRDLDPEHLHDFRVAVRRSRTLQRHFAALLDGPGFAALRQGFAWLGRVTGPTRDLDVHIESLDAISSRASDEERTSLAPIGGLLAERRRGAWEQLVSALDSERYAALMADADTFAAPDGVIASRGEAGPRIGPIAGDRLGRAVQLLRKRGRHVQPNAPDRRLHAARIAAKRLRYLLEFFQTLLDPEELRSLVKRMKRLQDDLGAFNDASVQIGALEQFANEIAHTGPVRVESLLLLGRLIERNSRRMATRRRDLVRDFRQFEAPGTRRRIRALLDPLATTSGVASTSNGEGE